MKKTLVIALSLITIFISNSRAYAVEKEGVKFEQEVKKQENIL